MADIITTLHPENDENINLYPNIKQENIPDGAVNASKLDPNVLSMINELHPSGVDTSTNILSKTSNEGIWVGSDNGKWYYWDGMQYVEGGNYIANSDSCVYHNNNQLKDNNGNNIYPIINGDSVPDGAITPIKTSFFDYDEEYYNSTYVSNPAYNINTVFFGFATQITPPDAITKVIGHLKSTAVQTLTCEIWSYYFNNVKTVIATTTKSINVADTYVNVEFDFGGIDLSGYNNVWIAIYSTNSTPISWANLTGIASSIVNTPTTSVPNAYLTSVWNNYSNNLNFSVAIQVIKGLPKVKSTYIRSEYTMNYLYVSTSGNDSTGNGTKENPFATIYAANDSISDNSKTNRYTIIVKNGTYTDLQERYSGPITSGPNYVGVICKDYVYYESEDILHPENCVLSWDGYYGCTGTITVNDIIRKAIFHINSGDMSDGVGSMHTHVKGFTITAKNVRYAFHVELEGRGYNTEWEISNCILNWYGRPECSDDSRVTPVIGLGGGYFEKGIIRNCSINNLQSGNDYGIQEHDNRWSSLYTFNPSVYKGIEILIENCNLNNSNINFRSYVDDANLTNVSKNILTIKQCINVSTLFFNTIGTATTIQWNDVIYSSDITTDNTTSYRSIQ